MRKLCSILFFSICLVSVFAQKHIRSKTSIYSYKQLTQRNDTLVEMLVRGEAKAICQQAKKLGGKITHVHGNIVSLKIPKDEITKLIESRSVNRFELPMRRVQLLNDTARIHNGIDKIHRGTLPLSQSYTGKGVIMGIVDSGIDIDHADFKENDTSTRILFLWDQQAGRVWNKQQIDSGVCTHTDYAIFNSHGTNVAGVAAGNGKASGLHVGMAPEADLVIVATDFSEVSIVDAVDYIFHIADSLGKPAVINLSLGTYFGSHDGNDLSAQAINNMIEEKHGRAVVCAAGNAGQIPYHVQHSIRNDTAITWFQDNSGYDVDVFFVGFADTQNMDSLTFSIGADNPNGWKFEGNIPFRTIDQILDTTLVDTLYDSSMNKIGIVFSEAVLINDSTTYEMSFWALVDSSDRYWRFMTTGTGKVDIWSSSNSGIIGTSDIISTGLPDTNTFPLIKKYQRVDKNMSITSGWTCAKNVITVGNYNNLRYYLDVDSNLQSCPAPDTVAGELASTSSWGPTRDGRIKPEITASGNCIFTAGNDTTVKLLLLGSSNRSKIAPDTLHMRAGGTSMAAPIVAGFAALYLQKNPTATFQELKDSIIAHAIQDVFTGTETSNAWGYGKLDAFASLASPIVQGCTDTSALNYDSTANVDDGSCISKVFGCMDTSSINYDSTANVDDGSCVLKIYGCTDTSALNYDSTANVDDGSCISKVFGCMDTSSINYDSAANVDDGSCILKTYGCTDTSALNYDSTANVDDGSCISKVFGCMDTSSINYDSAANVDDGSCVLKIYGCTDTSALNYDSTANVDDGSCITKVYGCLDSLALNYDSSANIDDGSCLFNYVVGATSDEINVYPNPTHDIIKIVSKVEVEDYILMNQLGVVVRHEKAKIGETYMDLSNMASGVYFLLIKTSMQPNYINKVIRY